MNPEQNPLEETPIIPQDNVSTEPQQETQSIIPEDPTPLETSTTTPESGTIGAELNPSTFSSSDPLLSQDNSAVEQTSMPEPTPSIALNAEPKEKKPLNKGVIAAIIVTILNLAISTTAVIICLNTSNKSDNNSAPLAVDATEENTLPGSLQCKVEECLSKLVAKDTIDSIQQKLGIQAKKPNSYEFVLDKDAEMTVNFSSSLSASITLKNPLEYSKIKTNKEAIVQALGLEKSKYIDGSYSTSYSTKPKDISYKEVVKLLDNVEGTLIGKNFGSNDTTYLWANPTESFTIKVRFDDDKFSYATITTEKD